jgi:hypothetical protein
MNKKTSERAAAFERCIAACERCLAALTPDDGGSANPSCREILRSCARLCAQALEEVRLNSAYRAQVCGLCALLCRACMEECRQCAGEQFAACAEACALAAVNCRELALQF